MIDVPASPAPARLPARWRVAAASFVLVPALVAGGLYVKVDAYALGPGPAKNVSTLIRVSGGPSRSAGSYLITTVSVTVDTINVFEALRAWVDPVIETVPRERLIPRGVTDREQDELNQADMEESKYFAAVVAAEAAGRDVRPVPGARIIKVFDGSPAAETLRSGDVIVAVEGTAVASVQEMSAAIREHPVGTALRIEVLRGAARRTFTIRTRADTADPSRPIIGVYAGPAFRLPVDIDIDSQDIVGPSGGLVFALAIVDALLPEDLTGGHRIAATGTISLTGEVGRIGGVAQKVRAAEYAGADIFLVPADEVAEAEAAARSIRVYGIRDIGQAVELLKGLNAE